LLGIVWGLRLRIGDWCVCRWSERLRIVMGVTTALVYLHHETCENAVVHCDLKAANVLLDSDMEPKLVDFGMATLVKRSNGATAASRVGSSGYAPPEYGFSSEFTRAGDVYSYGVLLLEIITGKRPTSEDVGAGVTLPAWVRSLKAQNRERYAIDMALFRAADEPQIDQILHILDAALVCTSYVPASRPSMLRVLGTLQEMPESVAEEELVPVEEEAPVDSSSSSMDQDQ
jgi:LRR receptor-like serine/threonine-protein kinase FLS2